MDGKKINLKNVIITAAVSSVFTLMTSLFLIYINNKKAALEYEILPVSYFKKDNIKLSIVSLRIINSGKKELENISFNISFGDTLSTNDFTFDKSSETITINRMIDSFTMKPYYLIPYLNPKEQIICSFLLNTVIDQSALNVSLRSKGINGSLINNSQDKITPLLMLGTIGMLILTIGLIIFIYFNHKRIEKLRTILDELKEKRISELEGILEQNNINYKEISRINKK